MLSIVETNTIAGYITLWSTNHEFCFLSQRLFFLLRVNVTQGGQGQGGKQRQRPERQQQQQVPRGSLLGEQAVQGGRVRFIRWFVWPVYLIGLIWVDWLIRLIWLVDHHTLETELPHEYPTTGLSWHTFDRIGSTGWFDWFDWLITLFDRFAVRVSNHGSVVTPLWLDWFDWLMRLIWLVDYHTL